MLARGQGRVKVLTVMGTRPEAIKLATVIRELRRRTGNRGLRAIVCVTGQHRAMLDQVLQLFKITVDHDLDIMEADQSPTRVAAAVLAGLEGVFQAERPDWVLVQGDTTTAAAAALAAFYARARVGHVEAGLRTYDKWQPFPEEVNRRVASAVADLHFAPTARARENLLQEHVAADVIVVTGNPVIDALQWVAGQAPTDEVVTLLRTLGQEGGSAAVGDAGSARRGLAPRLVLLTAHRRENLGQPLEEVCAAVRELAKRYDGDVEIVYPVHLNPHVWGPVHRLLDGVAHVTLTPPLDYLPLVHLMKRAHLVLTDSGGIQEEAPGLGVPVLVMREVTERPEAVEAGTVRMVGTDRARIVAESVRLLDDAEAHAEMARRINPYGDGRAAARIVGTLLGETVEPWRAPVAPIEALAEMTTR